MSTLKTSVHDTAGFTLGDWNRRASVRSSTHDYQLPEDVQQQLQTRHWFPPPSCPIWPIRPLKPPGATCCIG